MNKLVSKNPVLRFKLGSKIKKMQGGDVFYQSYGNFVNKQTGKVYTPEQYIQYKLDRLRNAGYINNNNNWIGSINKSSQPKPVVPKPKPRSGWSYGYNRSNEISDIKATQQMLKDARYLSSDKYDVVDGKWGKDTENAYIRYLNKLKAMELPPEVLYIQNPIKVTPQPTPDFGYKTNNTYEDSDFSNRLKSMGIRSNADLIDFGWRTLGNDYDWKGDNWAKQFRSDINLALGGDWSDANIRKVFNTSGNWGRGFLGRGDVGDLQNSLLINAGTWNGLYDKKQQEDLSSRTGLNGIVYSNSHIRDLFDKVKLNKYTPFTDQLTNVSNASLGIKTPGYANWRTLLNNRLSYYKQGGQLVSRNPVKRFKSNFRLVAQ